MTLSGCRCLEQENGPEASWGAFQMIISDTFGEFAFSSEDANGQ